MTEPLLNSELDAADRLVWSREIAAALNVTDRALRNYIADGTFPRPDGNLHGRNFWRKSTVAAFQSDLFAGKFRATRFTVSKGAEPSGRRENATQPSAETLAVSAP